MLSYIFVEHQKPFFDIVYISGVSILLHNSMLRFYIVNVNSSCKQWHIINILGTYTTHTHTHRVWWIKEDGKRRISNEHSRESILDQTSKWFNSVKKHISIIINNHDASLCHHQHFSRFILLLVADLVLYRIRIVLCVFYYKIPG